MNRTEVKAAADRLFDRLVSWRRELHAHPELGFEETWTAAMLERNLDGLELQVAPGVAGTGLVAVLRSERPAGPAVLLRSDMDALPVQETAGREYGSRIEGKMHACGHDGHMAMLLGAATLLSEKRKELTRDVVFCFQPAEEALGGAKRMIGEGILSEYGVGSAFALHLWAPFPAGTLQACPGPALASSDEFTAIFHGRAGHAALPQETRDPLLAACSGVVGLQQVASRSVAPEKPAVVSVGSVQAGSAPNIIPDRSTIEGTLRSFEPEVRDTLHRRLGEVLEGSAAASGCSVEIEIRPGYPPVVNDPGAVETVSTIAAGVLGADRVSQHPPMAISEDFAYFLEQVPGALALLGAGNREKGITAPHHSPEFDIDESVLPRGVEILAGLALGGPVKND